jgi:hypothetical protein
MVADCDLAQLSLNDEASARISKAIVALRKVIPGQAVEAIAFGQIKFNISTSHVSDLVTAFAAIADVQKVLVVRAESSGLAEVAEALHEYRRLLKEFRANLPCIQGWLLAERAKLESRRSHCAAVESWLRTGRQTRWL